MARKKRKPNTRAILNQIRYGTNNPKVMMEIETKDDAKFFRNANLRWDDIEKLDLNLVKQSTKLASELLPVAENKDVIDNLGDRKELFVKAFNTFKNDFSKFLDDLDAIKSKWEGKRGQIKNMEDFTLYNMVAHEYNDINLRFVSFSQLAGSTITVEAMQAIQRRDKARDEANNIEEGVFTEVENKELEAAQEGNLFKEEETVNAEQK